MSSPAPTVLPPLASRLRDARLAFVEGGSKRPLSQAQLAARVDVTVNSISEIERGRMPRTDLLLRLAAALGVKASWLLGEESAPHSYAASQKATPVVREGDAPAAVLADVAARTQANVLKLAEISGYAKAVLRMMQSITSEQQRVVDSLDPWVDRETEIGSTALWSNEDLRARADAIAEAHNAEPTTPLGETAAGASRRAAKGAR